DVLYAFVVHPVGKGFFALLGEDGNTISPGRTSAEDAVELHARFGRQLECLRELVVAHAGREIDKRLLRYRRRLPEQLNGFLARICRALASVALYAFHKLHIDWDFGFHHVHAVLLFGELFHAADHALRLALGILQTLFVPALRIVADELKEEGNIFTAALITDALDKCVLFLVHLFGIKRRIIDEDLYAIGPGGLQSPYRPEVKQIGNPARTSVVIS